MEADQQSVSEKTLSLLEFLNATFRLHAMLQLLESISLRVEEYAKIILISMINAKFTEEERAINLGKRAHSQVLLLLNRHETP